MLDRINRVIAAILLSRFVVRLFVKELKIGIRDYIFDGNVQVYLNTCHPYEKFAGVIALAKLAKHYGLPVHIHTWFRHEEGVRHSYFEPTDIYIRPDDSETVLEMIRDQIEGSRSKIVALAVCEPGAELKPAHPITM